jgi:predicted transcriptional regulator YdeE
MKVIGISKIVSNANPEDIHELWQRFYSENISEKILNKSSNNIISVYTRYQGDYTKPYTIIIGHEVTEQDFLGVSELDHVEINNTNHTKFVVTGKLPDVVIQKWIEVWDSERERTYIADYDVYHQDGSVTIYVEFSK